MHAERTHLYVCTLPFVRRMLRAAVVPTTTASMSVNATSTAREDIAASSVHARMFTL